MRPRLIAAESSNNAWNQNFNNGNQSFWLKYDKYRARAVRKVLAGCEPC